MYKKHRQNKGNSCSRKFNRNSTFVLVGVKELFMELHIIWAVTYQFCQATPRPAVDVQLENGCSEETHFAG